MGTGKKDLSALLDKKRKELDVGKEELKNFFNKVAHDNSGKEHKSSYINNILNGTKAPEITFLIALYAALQGKSFPKEIVSEEELAKDKTAKAKALQKTVKTNKYELQKILVNWLQAILEQDLKRNPQYPIVIEASYLDKWVEAIRELKSDFDKRENYNSALPTLDYFPDAFTPLTVITGTGLAIPPTRISDLFRANASLTDLFFLNELKLPKDTRIVSDRFVIDMNPQDRIKHFGNRHLLLIGGPKVNAVTRKFGKYGFFRFQVQDEEMNFQDFYDSLRDDLFQESDCVKMLYELLVNPKRPHYDKDFQIMVNDENLREQLYNKSIEILAKRGDPKKFTYKDIVKVFIPKLLVDPVRNLCEFPKADSGKDLTMITIAPNFYNRGFGETASFESYKSEFVSIIVAGVDGLGTAAGVKKLTQPADFKDYPVGGFLEAVGGNSNLDFERYSKSKCSWNELLTPPYSIDALIKDIQDFTNQPDEKKDKTSALYRIEQEEWLDVKGLGNYLKFLEMFRTKK